MRTLIIFLAVCFVGGCGEKIVPVTDLRPWKPISSSCKDTPDTRAEIRAHNGVYQSLKTGKKVVYADDCPAEPKEQPPKPMS